MESLIISFLNKNLAPNLCQRFNLDIDEVVEEIEKMKTLIPANISSGYSSTNTSYLNLTVKQLREIAYEKGIKVPVRIKKDDIKILLEKHDNGVVVEKKEKQNHDNGVVVDKKQRKKIIKIDSEIWIIGKLLAKGGFGRVYETTCDNVTGHFVVKVERKSKFSTLPTEKHIYDLLRHDEREFNMVGYYEDKNFHYMVLPKLQNTLACGVVSSEDVDNLIKDVCASLNKIHNLGYCHLDVKPQNIMYSELLEKWCVIDLGLCKKITQKECGLVGTYDFMSRGVHEGRFNKKSDFESLLYSVAFALGVDMEWLEINEKEDNFVNKIYEAKKTFMENIETTFKPFMNIKGVKKLVKYFKSEESYASFKI